MPGWTTVTRSASKPRSSTSSGLDDSDSVAIAERRYSGGATLVSNRAPIGPERGAEGHVPHLGVHVVQEDDPGPGFHSGLRNGMPFQISISTSRGPVRPGISASAARGNTW